MRGTGRRAFRRTARVGGAVAVASVLTFAITSPGSAATSQNAAPATTFSPGTGSAIALVYKVNPLFGNLSFGITAGESVAGHQNTGAQAQSKAVNLGVIGVTLAGPGCKGADPALAADKQPQAVIVGSDDPGAAAGRSSSLGSGAITQFAQATRAPFAKAVTTVAPAGVPNGLELAGGSSTATSGIIKPGVRDAHATTVIDHVSLLGGLVTLGGLRWDAEQQTGGTTASTGSFSLGSINLLGAAIPLPNNALDQLKTLKDVLGSLGLSISSPATRVEQGIVFVDPMKIGIIPSAARDNVIATLLGNLQSSRQTLVDALNQLGCNGSTNVAGNNISTLITLLDLSLATVSGAGALTVELGGVQATTATINGFNGLGVVPALPSVSSGDGGAGLSAPVTGSDYTALPAEVPPVATTTPSTGGAAAVPTKTIAKVHGDRGGLLAGVSAGGLLLLLATAEGDRRKMRRAQREIPLEA